MHRPIISRKKRKETIKVARIMRRMPTKMEAKLWEAIRDQRVEGCRFRRQHPFGPYILDFFAPKKQLAVEVDGAVYELQEEWDFQRDRYLNSYGVRVLRLRVSELESDFEGGVEKIRRSLAAP